MKTSRGTAILLILPALLLLAGLTLFPLLRGVALSFFSTEYGFEGARLVATRNYGDLLDDRFFRRATTNTVWFTLLATFSELALGLACTPALREQLIRTTGVGT